jgi:hypothetical protein
MLWRFKSAIACILKLNHAINTDVFNFFTEYDTVSKFEHGYYFAMAGLPVTAVERLYTNYTELWIINIVKP